MKRILSVFLIFAIIFTFATSFVSAEQSQYHEKMYNKFIQNLPDNATENYIDFINAVYDFILFNMQVKNQINYSIDSIKTCANLFKDKYFTLVSKFEKLTYADADDEELSEIQYVLEQINEIYSSYYQPLIEIMKDETQFNALRDIIDSLNECYEELPQQYFKLLHNGEIVDNYTDIFENDSIKIDLKYPGEKVFFRFVPKSTGDYTFSSSGNRNSYCLLLDEKYKVIYSNDDSFNKNFKFSFNFEKGKSYYFCVSAYDIIDEENIINVYLKAGKTDNIFEKVTIDEYKDINVDQTTSGKGSNFDKLTYYRFVPDQTTSYVFSMIGGCNNFKFILFDKNGNYLCHGRNQSLFGIGFSIELQKGESYYIGTYSEYGYDYSVRVKKGVLEDLYTKVSINEYTDIACDETQKVDVKSKQIKYFKFVPENTDSYIFSFSVPNSAVICFLYDKEGNCIYNDERMLDLSFSYNLNKGEQYYIGAFALLGDCEYTLSVSKGEINDIHKKVIVKEYREINSGQTQLLNFSQQDEIKYLRFIPEKTTHYSISSSQQDLSYNIYNNAGIRVDSFSGDIFYEFAKGETYYIGVLNNDFEKVSVSLKEGLINLNGRVNIKYNYTDIDCFEQTEVNLKQDEMKFFRFIPDETNVYSFISKGEFDTYCVFYDKYGNYMDSNDDYLLDINFGLSENLQKGEVYYIGVSCNEDADFTFTISKGGLCEDLDGVIFNDLFGCRKFGINSFVDKRNISTTQYDNLKNVIIKAKQLSDETKSYLSDIGFLDILNSVAEFIQIYENNVIYGDINADGVVNGKDSLMLRKYNANYPIEIDFKVADVNNDGKVNAKDSLLLRQYIANWDVILG